MKTRLIAYLGGLIVFFGVMIIISAEGEQEGTLTLSDKNTVSLRLPVTDVTVKDISTTLLTKSGKLSKSDSIYLTLNSPGGDIDAGNALIEVAKGLPQKVHTLSLFSASMSFIISQGLSTRYVLSNSKLMSHRAYARGLEGQIPGSLLTRTLSLLADITRLETQVADRAQMKLEDYQKLIANELWIDGTHAVEMKFADKLVKVRCDASLNGPADEQIFDLFIFKAHVVFHKCPLISAPLSVKIEDIVKTAKDSEARQALYEALYDKPAFVEYYVKTNRIGTIAR